VLILNSENPNPEAENASPPAPKQIGPFAYIVAMMSVMPGLGVILGPAAMIWGLATWKRGGKLVVVIGAMGFGGQLLFFVFLIHKLFN
jgi:hypothetical protein